MGNKSCEKFEPQSEEEEKIKEFNDNAIHGSDTLKDKIVSNADWDEVDSILTKDIAEAIQKLKDKKNLWTNGNNVEMITIEVKDFNEIMGVWT